MFYNFEVITSCPDDMLLQTLIAFYSDGWWNIIVIAITQEYRLKSSDGICCFVRRSFQIGFPFWQKRSRTSSTGNKPDGFISFFLFCRLSGSIFKQKRRRANASSVYFCASVLSTKRKTVSAPRASDAFQPVPNVSYDFERCWRIHSVLLGTQSIRLDDVWRRN